MTHGGYEPLGVGIICAKPGSNYSCAQGAGRMEQDGEWRSASPEG